jgi:hypothetical protein
MGERLAKFLLAFALATVAGVVLLSHSSQSYVQGQFPTEQQAQQHCPNDTVVWLNLYSGIYHFKGQLWYANTSKGAFVCQREADRAGDRATRNGE